MKLDLLHRIDFICFDLFPKYANWIRNQNPNSHTLTHTHSPKYPYKHNGSIAIAEMNTFWSNCRDSSIVVVVPVLGMRDVPRDVAVYVDTVDWLGGNIPPKYHPLKPTHILALPLTFSSFCCSSWFKCYCCFRFSFSFNFYFCCWQLSDQHLAAVLALKCQQIFLGHVSVSDLGRMRFNVPHVKPSLAKTKLASQSNGKSKRFSANRQTLFWFYVHGLTDQRLKWPKLSSRVWLPSMLYSKCS